MAESSDSSPLGFLWRHFEEVKEHWKSNFSFLDYYKKSLGRKEPLPKWTDADVEEFIASDPVYGPQVPAFPSVTEGYFFSYLLFLMVFVSMPLLYLGDELGVDPRRSGSGL